MDIIEFLKLFAHQRRVVPIVGAQTEVLRLFDSGSYVLFHAANITAVMTRIATHSGSKTGS